VVMENIFRFIDEKHYKPFDAAIAATKEIGLAVLSITLSLVAVFLPIAFMGGIVGKFLKCFGITMAATVVVSMIVSFTLTPMISARWFKAAPPAGPGKGKSDGKRGKTDGAKWLIFYAWIESGYRVLLAFCLKQRWIVVLAVLVSLGSVPFLMMFVRVNFIPDDDQAQFQISARAPEGTTLEATRAILDRMAREVRELNGIRYTIASVGDDEQRTPNKMPSILFVSKFFPNTPKKTAYGSAWGRSRRFPAAV
jgi:HAE1 family hydrophobic/amphiphilic exporter-1